MHIILSVFYRAVNGNIQIIVREQVERRCSSPAEVTKIFGITH
nr:MAG TPA: hypothetical protein [Caudoviricetes sp.]